MKSTNKVWYCNSPGFLLLFFLSFYKTETLKGGNRGILDRTILYQERFLIWKFHHMVGTVPSRPERTSMSVWRFSCPPETWEAAPRLQLPHRGTCADSLCERSRPLQDPFGLNLTLYPDKGEKNLVTRHLLFKVQDSQSCLSQLTGMCGLTVTLCNVTFWLHDQPNWLGNLRKLVARLLWKEGPRSHHDDSCYKKYICVPENKLES